jgi:hypothetical protein
MSHLISLTIPAHSGKVGGLDRRKEMYYNAEFDISKELSERVLEYVIQARDGLITKSEMADKIEALFPQGFEELGI